MTLTTPASVTNASPRPPTLWARVQFTTTVLVRGQLAWLGWVWLSVLVLLPVGLVAISIAGGDLTESVWSGAGIGWQRWMLFAAGLATIRTFLREFVSRGVTRHRIADAATLTTAALAIGMAAVGMIGYLLEWLVYRALGWRFGFSGDTDPTAALLTRLALEYALAGAAYFAAGWLIGAAFVRYRWQFGVALIPACFVGVVVVELVLGTDAANLRINDARHPALAVTVIVALAAIAASVVVARRVTRTLPLR